jgi:hypothetical protein
MTRKVTDRELIRRALYDAISDREGYAHALERSPADKELYLKTLNLVEQYKAMLDRRYRSHKTQRQTDIENAKSVSIYDIKKKCTEQPDV